MKLKRNLQNYEIKLFGLFVLSLLIYLAIAYFIHWPAGYYGSLEQPRFADPWIARTETILSGGFLYRDVFTTTPPLTNFLLIPPSFISGLFGHVNPWSTLSFMLYFSLFNYFGALALLYMGETRREGYLAAILFLLNPLTFGNTILRRQDESIIVFFIGVAFLFLLKRKHISASISIGISMLVKLTGSIVLPIAVLHTRKWHYFILPAAVFFAILAPFYVVAGRDAIFWAPSLSGGEHPFQFRGVSPLALWNNFPNQLQQIELFWPSAIMIIGVGTALLFIAWKRIGILEDFTILVSTIFIFSPKLHTGYFSMLALSMAPLLFKYRLTWLYFLFGGLAMLADYYKWPIENFPISFYLMIVVLGLLLIAMINIIRKNALISQKRLSFDLETT